MNSLFENVDLQPRPLYSEPVKFKHFSGVAKAVLSARDVLETPSEQPRENEAEVLERQKRENERRANSEFWQNYGRKGRK